MTDAVLEHASSSSLPRSYNEMRCRTGLAPGYREIDRWLREDVGETLDRGSRASEELFRRRGITFAVYGDAEGSRRLIPFDIIPRVLTESEWKRVADGCMQRVRALNAFLCDI